MVVDSATSQFFVNLADNAGLDYPNRGGYAVFARVVEGMDVVKKMEALGSRSGQTSKKITIVDCGELKAEAAPAEEEAQGPEEGRAPRGHARSLRQVGSGPRALEPRRLANPVALTENRWRR